jgi:plasmid stabilization system protein ParE
VAYQVVLADTAKADANEIYDWVVERSPIRGPEWFSELIDCLYSLEELPYRCPVAREAKEANREIRCLLFGKRKYVYRILYEVDETQKIVGVLHIRHAALRDLRPEQLSHL